MGALRLVLQSFSAGLSNLFICAHEFFKGAGLGWSARPKAGFSSQPLPEAGIAISTVHYKYFK